MDPGELLLLKKRLQARLLRDLRRSPAYRHERLPDDGQVATDKFVTWTVNFVRLLRVTDPPITMFTPKIGELFDKDKHITVNERKEKPPGSRVTSVLFPGLMMNGAALVKAKVTTLPLKTAREPVPEEIDVV